MIAEIILLVLLFKKTLCSGASNPEAALYAAIHDLALPPPKLDEFITERFIMLEPGEVLNYHDYVPLDKDTPTFVNSGRLPPDEAAFRLSDTVPSSKPVGGGITGKSLSTIYSDILYQIDTTNITDDSFTTEAYINAMKYLQEKVSDPADTSAPKISWSELYHRYKQCYYDTKLQVSQWILGNKTDHSKELSYLDWYQESYPTLVAFTSMAYSQWLIEGQKGPVEDKLAIVDIKSVRSEIESAKNLFQDEALPSAVGGSSYYPVEFIPSTWYEYLQVE